VRIFSDGERRRVEGYVRNGHTLVVTGADATQLGEGNNIVRFPDAQGKRIQALWRLTSSMLPDSQEFFLKNLKNATTLEISASPHVVLSRPRGREAPHLLR